MHKCSRFKCVLCPDSKVHGPTWGPPGSYRPQMGPMLAPWTLLSGWLPSSPTPDTKRSQGSSPAQLTITAYIIILAFVITLMESASDWQNEPQVFLQCNLDISQPIFPTEQHKAHLRHIRWIHEFKILPMFYLYLCCADYHFDGLIWKRCNYNVWGHWSIEFTSTNESHYSMVENLQNMPNKHPLTCPWRWDVSCVL